MKTTVLLLAIALLPALGQPSSSSAGSSKAASSKAGPKSAATSPIPSYDKLSYPPLKQVKLPEPAEVTLANGMRVFLLEDHELPLIRGFALIRTGNLFDPSDKRGLSQVTAEVLRSGGTHAKTGDQIDEDLEDIAASVESSMGETSATVSFSGLKETGVQVLNVFKDVLTQPEFRQDKLDLALNQLRGGIARRNDEASAIPRRELLDLIYGRDNPYGWTTEYEHLNRIKRQDLIDFYQRYYFPKNIMLAVYGDFNTAEMRTQLEQLFSSWTVDKPAVPPFPAVTAKPAPGVYLAAKPDVTQSFFSIGELGGKLNDKDYPALEVATNILGEGFNSRLMAQIRTKLGFAYSIGATWAADYDHPGTFRIGGSTKSGSTVETIQAIKTEVEKMRTTEVTPVELNEAKQAVLNGFVFNFDSPEKTLRRVLTYTYFSYPKDFLFQYQKAIENVTRADVLRVMKQYIQPDQFTIVAAGNPKDMTTPLSTLGTVHEIDLTIPEPARAVSKADGASLAKGKAMLQRAQQAVGGAEKLAGIKDMTSKQELALSQGQGGLKLQITVRYLAPDYFRQDQVLPFGSVVAFLHGATGWLASPQGVQDMTPDLVREASGDRFRHLPTLLLSDRAKDRTVNAIDDSTVEITSGMDSVRIAFDAAGLPQSLTYRGTGASGAPAETVERLSDYRDAGGFRLPFHIQLAEGGQTSAEITVTSYAFNTGLTPEEIGKKP